MKCRSCDRQTDGSLGIYCGRCDKIIGDVNTSIAAGLED